MWVHGALHFQPAGGLAAGAEEFLEGLQNPEQVGAVQTLALAALLSPEVPITAKDCMMGILTA